MFQNRRRNGLPDRWLNYRAVGKKLRGTRFIPFKVPLKQSLNSKVAPSDIFGPWELLDSIKKKKQQLGLIIDLTFTKRYYSVQDVPESLLVVKIFTRGHDIPSDDTILSFKRAVRSFLRNNSDNDKLIGVHCTHGVNRTGYLICRYLIDVNGMDPKEAIGLFNSCRGHPIERENYLQDLRSGPKRSNEGMDESEQEPIRGCAVLQQSESDSRENRGAHVSSHSGSNRPFPPGRGNRHSRNGPRHRPSFQAPLPLCHPYRCSNPDSHTQWRRRPQSEDFRPRYLAAEPERSSRPRLPRYSEEEWGGPGMR